MKIFDANVWIGFLYADDTTHTAAKKIFMQYKKSDIVLTEYIIMEVATVLKKKYSYKRAQEFLRVAVHSGQYKVLLSEEYYYQTVELFLTLKEKSLSFVDVSLLYLSQEYEIVTFDKCLKKRIKQL